MTWVYMENLLHGFSPRARTIIVVFDFLDF